MNARTAILLINVGSPDSPTKGAVRRYLTKFLNDKRVIDLPWLLRKILVNFIIIPFRVKKSTKLYLRLWTKKGSPLIYLTEELREKLQHEVDDNTRVFVGMRYGNPGLKKALREIKQVGFEKLILVPLFPQHAMSTTETALVAAKKRIKRLKIKAEVLETESFYDHPKFIEAFVRQAMKYDISGYDHVVFSYHGLPNRHIEKCHPKTKIDACSCTQSLPEHGKLCYRGACYETSRLLAKELQLNPEDYTVAFQSRLSKDWLNPFTDVILNEKLAQAKTKILVLAPSFVTDCLETILEIGMDYRDEFIKNGGEKLQLVDGLNANDHWVKALNQIVAETLKLKG